jgi:AP2 domain
VFVWEGDGKPLIFENHGDAMKFVGLTQGYAAIVDDADYERVMDAGPWHAVTKRRTGIVYAQRHTYKKDGPRANVLLHRFILGITDPKVQVDHRNRYPLDCQRNNLRVATGSQNNGNMSKPRHGKTSRFKGVSWHKSSGKWRAVIALNRKHRHVGSFADELSAARAYDAAAREQWGEFAKCNLGQKPTTKKG